MKKLLFMTFFIPALMCLGHDLYIFGKNPEKGFGFTDLGVLWAKYHPQSHDRWKIEILKIEDQVNVFLFREENAVQTEGEEEAEQKELEDKTEDVAEGETEVLPDYMQPITIIDRKDAPQSVETGIQEKDNKIETTGAREIIGAILKQKGVFVFGGVALFLYLVNSLYIAIKTYRDKWMPRKYRKMPGRTGIKKSKYQYKRR